MFRGYKYKIYPTRSQVASLNEQLNYGRDLYNSALDERRWAWNRRARVGFIQQSKELTELRQAGLSPAMDAWTQHQILRRLDQTYQAFYRRCKAGEKAGYPRHKGCNRFNTLTWRPTGKTFNDNGRLYIHSVGYIKVKWHRPLPRNSRARTIAVTRANGFWHVMIVVELIDPQVHTNSGLPDVGIDLGITTFVALSTGELIKGPRAGRKSAQRLRAAQRRMSRRKKGSKRRGKARRIARRHHIHIANIRRDHAHKISRWLVDEYKFIAIEDLNVKGLAGGMLARDVSDQGWGQLIRFLHYKAEEAGGVVCAVNPHNTSQECSSCGVIVKKDLSVRVHDCACGLRIDRDVNAALNILSRARTEPSGANDEGLLCVVA